jgi:S-ribosylhomocysteine lyase LuxS involved in autoinducer biosynthesis
MNEKEIEKITNAAIEFYEKFIDYWYDKETPNMNRDECKNYNRRILKEKIKQITN